MDQKELEAAVTKLQDIEKIKRLHARYGYLIDSGQMEEVGELFTDDAIADWGGLRGRYEGKEEIRGFFVDRTPKSAAMLRHQFMQPDIEIDGDRARAKWYMFGFGTYKLKQGDTPAWTHGKYDNDMVKTNGIWKISYLRFEFTFQTPFHDGWVKTPAITPDQFRELG
ncbi:nuclear transport factor 2 family protein [Thermodesulfobacteriota bacterium]